MSPQPYQISVPQSKLDTLKTKLSLASFPDEVAKAEWDLGVPLSELKRLAKVWESWDWRQAEERLNRTLPQFHTGIAVDGFGELDIHFVWQKSEVKNAIPLLFVHGWPGSFIEVQHLLPLLAAPGGPAFHVIAPSLPNFGFSGCVQSRGFALAQYAETCHKLMLQLGYPQYVTQAGDWGFYITRAMGLLYPNSCKASHVNMLRCFQPTFSSHPLLALQHKITPYTAREKAGLERGQWFLTESHGYYVLQSTKPQTLAYALNDSPVALLGWIYEKLHDWTDGYKWTDEQLLEWISVYAFSTAGPGAAHRIYYEVGHTDKERGVTRVRTMQWIGGVPLGLAYNPKELGLVPKTWARTLGPVVFEAHHESGGHFMAHERPEYLAKDLKAMFGKGGGAFGVVEGKSGYDKTKARL